MTVFFDYSSPFPPGSALPDVKWKNVNSKLQLLKWKQAASKELELNEQHYAYPGTVQRISVVLVQETASRSLPITGVAVII